MPWTEKDAQSKTHKADTPRLQHLWERVANRARNGGNDDASAIRIANAAVAKQKHRKNT